jgi:hypothetical protein
MMHDSQILIIIFANLNLNFAIALSNFEFINLTKTLSKKNCHNKNNKIIKLSQLLISRYYLVKILNKLFFGQNV